MRSKIGFYAFGILSIVVLTLSGCKSTTSTVTVTPTTTTQTTNQQINQSSTPQVVQPDGRSEQTAPEEQNNNQLPGSNAQQPTVTQPAATAPSEETSPLQINTSSLSSGSCYTAYATTLSASGGKAPYTWRIVSGNLPNGLSLASNTGIIEGTPTISGTYTFTIQVTDSSSIVKTVTQSYSLNIAVGEVNISTTSLPDGTTGESYSETLAASGGSGDYTWSKSSGTLPTGLSLGSTTGILKGTPTAAGEFTFTIKVKDNDTDETDTQSYTVTIEAGEIEISTTSLSDGTAGEYYSETLEASGGSGDYTWSKSSGTLPTGLSLSSTTGILKGTPTTIGEFTFTVKVKDNDTDETDTQSYTVTIEAGEVEISTTSLSDGTADEYYTETLTARYGSGDYTWSVYSGDLPDGLTLSSSSGLVKGTPTTAGDYTFTIMVEDTDTGDTDTQSFTITIEE